MRLIGGQRGPQNKPEVGGATVILLQRVSWLVGTPVTVVVAGGRAWQEVAFGCEPVAAPPSPAPTCSITTRPHCLLELLTLPQHPVCALKKKILNRACFHEGIQGIPSSTPNSAVEKQWYVF